MKGEEVNRADLAASFQKAVVDVLVEHTMLAAGDYKMTKMLLQEGLLPMVHFVLQWKRHAQKRGIYVLSSITDFLYRQCCDDRGSCIL